MITCTRAMGHKTMFVLSVYTIFAMILNVAILLGAVHVKKNTVKVVSHIFNVMRVGRITAINVKD